MDTKNIFMCVTRESWLILLLSLFLALPTHAQDVYRVGPGDTLSIQVYDEPDMSLPQILVGPEGTISFPLLGEMVIAGSTASEIEGKITEQLLDGYLKKPKVTVSILAYRLFFVTGHVKRPGGYNYVVGLTVRKAIALAGGIAIRGNENKLTKFKEGSSDSSIKVNMDSPLGPGEILNVGESFF